MSGGVSLQEDTRKLAKEKAKRMAEVRALIRGFIVFLIVWLSVFWISLIIGNIDIFLNGFLYALIIGIVSYFMIKEKNYEEYYEIYLKEITSRREYQKSDES